MAPQFSYPPAKQDDTVDDYHGTLVADPYRWLEDPDSPDSKAWVAAQNDLTRQFIDELPAHQQFTGQLTTMWDYAKYSAPTNRPGLIFYQLNDGLQNQPILYKQKADEPRQVLLDPNSLSEDGTVALINQSYTKDGRYLAYSLSQSGSDWQTIYVRDTDTGQDTGDVVTWCKFTNAAWLPDNSGFFYARYPAPGEMPEAEPSTHQRVYFHRLGTDQAEDKLVFAMPDEPTMGFNPQVTDDGRYLLLHIWQGTLRQNLVFYRDLEEDGEFGRLIETMEANFSYLGNDGTRFYFETDFKAENSRIIAIDITQPDRRHWQDVVPEAEAVLTASKMVNDHFVVKRLHHAADRLYLYGKDGRPAGEIPLPGLGSILELSGSNRDTHFYINFQSFLFPPTIYRYDFDTEGLTAVFFPTTHFDPDKYETTQVFYQSKDGTTVPMFITHRQDLTPNGDTPTLLYGYGGFNISLPPAYNPTRLAWLEQGGIYAQANLRGGTEYGESWHQAGMLVNKQNVFDDFIAAAEWLIDNSYTRPARLAIEGRSNGGLLVAACMLQRPDLFGAVHCGVPVIDMLRYHKFTAGRYWIGEYGNAEAEPDHFDFMYEYSPLHNVQEGISYPPLIITTADTDDRVVPAHAKKFAATLQAADSGQNPLLLRVEMKAGHGLGKPTSKLIEQAADVYSFLWTILTTNP